VPLTNGLRKVNFNVIIRRFPEGKIAYIVIQGACVYV